MVPVRLVEVSAYKCEKDRAFELRSNLGHPLIKTVKRLLAEWRDSYLAIS